ncbi:MAG TPA: type I-MYXAN CRISPR-associated protein Cas6/Cmx6 [Burkholderiaceae bacterium]|nr:type I-MYXAN CRISPR-associated protein Cas6/Cmx6 [Burkholderiaceae bacterium]
MDAARASMVDVTFALTGDALPRDHGQLLAQALARRLPWLDDDAAVGVHRVKLVPGVCDPALLSQRSRLVLRVQRGRASEVTTLAGTMLDVGRHRVHLRAASVRELLSHGTLYAPMVIASIDTEGDELQFLASVESELAALGVRARTICGRRGALRHRDAQLDGFSLMLDGLSASDSLRVQQQGIGVHRRLGCGLFVPHRSAAAVQA